MSWNSKADIQVSYLTKSHLNRLCQNNGTYESIIRRMLENYIIPCMKRDFQKIEELAYGEIAVSYITVLERTLEIFDEINFDYGVYDKDDPNLDMQGVVEIAMSEEMVGYPAIRGDRILPLSEVVINVYCLLMEMSSPNTSEELKMNYGAETDYGDYY